MHITSLGHSALLLEWCTDVPTRMLIDPWLSDYCVGDLFGRWPRLRWSADSLGPVHAVFLSHAHTDHLDPYTLVRLWRELATPPVLVLPATLRFLLPLFEAHLPGVEVRWLSPRRSLELRGATLRGMFAPAGGHTNEDDVMVLIARCGEEVVLVEADCRVDMRDPARSHALHRALGGRGIRSAAWLTTENELDASLPMAECEDLQECLEQSLQGLGEVEVQTDALYVDVARPTPWTLPHLTRAIHGQGLTPPPQADPGWKTLLYPVRIEDRVRIERRVARSEGWAHEIMALRPGCTYRLAEGALTPIGPTDSVEILDSDDPRGCVPVEQGAPARRPGPVRPGLRDVEVQEQRFLEVLNTRLVPFLVGQNAPPLHLFLDGLGGEYRIRIHYGDPTEGCARDYSLGLGAFRFVRTAEQAGPDEAWWANDLEDVLDGASDEFTTFFRQPLPASEPLLRHCLSLPVLGYDLCYRKMKLHFERAAAGQGPGAWVAPLVST